MIKKVYNCINKKGGMSRWVTVIAMVVATVVVWMACMGVGVAEDGGLVAEWHFDEGAGSILHDSSGNGNDGMIYGATWTEGISGGALSFDGVDDYVEAFGSWGGRDWNEATIEAWVKTSSITGDFQAIVSSTGCNFFHLQLHSGGNIAFWNDAGITYFPIISQSPTGVWRHIAISVKSGNSKLYVDGIEVGSVSMAFSNITKATELHIGNGHQNGRFFNGIIDEVRIYNRALTADEIREHYYRYLPILTITFPNNGTIVTTPTITVTVTASDPSGIASVTVNGVLANGAADWSTWSAEVTLVEGENTITVVATDNAGNVATETITVYRVEPFTFIHLTDPHIGYYDITEEELPLLHEYGVAEVDPETMVESVEKFTDTLQAVKTHNPDFILNTGDLVESNNPDFFHAYAGILKSIEIPVYHTPGNHDRRDKWGRGDDLTNYNSIIKPDDCSVEPLGDFGDYYFDWKGYDFIGLDSGADYNVSDWMDIVGSSHIWLDDLYRLMRYSTPESDGLWRSQVENLYTRNKDLPKIIFMHHPVINDKDDEYYYDYEIQVPNDWLGYGNDACIAFNRCAFKDYCINNHVDLVLTGHTHKDYVKTVSNDLSTHKTCFIQTRSATKDGAGYRVIEIKEEGISNSIIDTPSFDKSTFTLSLADFSEEEPEGIWGITVFDSSSRLTGMDIITGDIVREIPDSYYTGHYDSAPHETPQVLVVLNPLDKLKSFKVEKPLEVSSYTAKESSKSLQDIYFNFSIRHRTENKTIEYRYDNVKLTDDSTTIVNLSVTNVNYTMEIDYDGDGTTDTTTEPTQTLINHAPNVSITKPAGDQSSNVTISFNLKDAESDNCTIIAQYSLDKITWHDATMAEGSDGIVNVTSTPDGMDHTFVWASYTDMQNMNAIVYFRIRPFDGDLSGDYATTDAFFVGNYSSGSISIRSANAPLNSTITIPVSVANVTNISWISFNLLYNSSVATVISVSANESFTGSSVTPNIDNANGITSIVLTNLNLISASAETPVIDIDFIITGGSGSATSLDLQNVEFSDVNSNPYIPAVVVDGQITVGTKGDFNGNGRVDIGDVAKVAFMVAGKVPKDVNADFNGNGRVDIGDAAKIAFYLAGKLSEL